MNRHFLAAASFHRVGNGFDKTGKAVFAIGHRCQNGVDLILRRRCTGDETPCVFSRAVGQRAALGSEPFKAEAQTRGIFGGT
ncbi:hypothetical protein D3C86_1391110 [compost metagenome]